jgi:hypothetical protein
VGFATGTALLTNWFRGLVGWLPVSAVSTFCETLPDRRQQLDNASAAARGHADLLFNSAHLDDVPLAEPALSDASAAFPFNALNTISSVVYEDRAKPMP